MGYLFFFLTYSSYTKITTSRGCITYIVGLTFIFYRLKCKAISTQTWEHTNHNLRTLQVQKYNCIKASRRQQIKIGCRGDLHSKKIQLFIFFFITPVSALGKAAQLSCLPCLCDLVCLKAQAAETQLRRNCTAIASLLFHLNYTKCILKCSLHLHRM